MINNIISLKDNGLMTKVKKTARIIMNYSSKPGKDAFTMAEKLHELRLRFLSNGPQLMAFYYTADSRAHIVKAELLKVHDPISLFIPFHNLLGDKEKLLTMRITHFLGFAQKKIVYFEGEKEPHEIYTTPEGIMDGEFIKHTNDLD